MAETAGHSDQRLIVVSDPAALKSSLVDARLPIDRPVVLLIGGASKLEQSASTDLLPIVRYGVIATAQALGATVIDGGTDAGVMALAGRSRQELGATVPMLGVAPIGRIEAAGVEGATGSTQLEPNHTHVLLAPGDEWGAESPWLIESARVLSGGKPVVVVVIDGGQVSGVEATKSQAEGWPLITVAGSGRTADDLARIARRQTRDGSVASEASGIYVTEMSAGPAPLAAILRALLTRQLPAGDGEKIEYPALYVSASEASKRGKTWFKALSGLELGLTVAGIAIAIGSYLLITEEHDMTALAPTVAVLAVAGTFLTAFVLKFINHSAGYDNDWFGGRAIAEAVKSASWRYMMRVDPYGEDDADERLTHELATLLRRATQIRQSVDQIVARPQQISASMRSVRARDLAGRRDTYVSSRLRAQAAWYGRKSGAARRAAERRFWIAIAFQLAAVLCALLALHLVHEHDLAGFWLRVMGLFASGAIAITAWTQLNRDEDLARAYAYSLQELSLIAGTAERATDEPALEQAVNAGEEAIGRENKAWLEGRSERREDPEFGLAD